RHRSRPRHASSIVRQLGGLFAADVVSGFVAFRPGISTNAVRGRIFALAGHAMYVVRGDDGGGGAARVPVGDATADAIYLGELDGEPCFAIDAGGSGGASELGESVALRQLYGVLSDEEFGVAGRALGMLAWDRDHRYCGRCGGPTERSPRERARTCAQCKHAAFQILSPAVCLIG